MLHMVRGRYTKRKKKKKRRLCAAAVENISRSPSVCITYFKLSHLRVPGLAAERNARARGFVRRSGLMSMTRATRFIILFFPHSSAERIRKTPVVAFAIS